MMTRTTVTCICERINGKQIALPGVQSARAVRLGRLDADWGVAYGVVLTGAQGQPLAILTEVEQYQALANHRPEPEWRWAPAGSLDLEKISF
jgi:hypothetical protein